MSLFMWLFTRMFAPVLPPVLCVELRAFAQVTHLPRRMLAFFNTLTILSSIHPVAACVRKILGDKQGNARIRRPSATRFAVHQAQLLPRSSVRLGAKPQRYQSPPMWVVVADICAMLLIAFGLAQTFAVIQLRDYLPVALQFLTDSDKLLLSGIVLTIPYLRWAWRQLLRPTS